jgi:hypothetical protein
MWNRPLRAAPCAAFVACALAAAVPAAHAALGGAPMPTPSDATTAIVSPTTHAASASTTGMASGVTGTAAAGYTVRATTFSTGTAVREYIGADGTVFGLAWSGPRMPDLQALLGSYFPQYASGVKALHAAHPGRGPVAIEQPGLVVHSGGHMGSFFGGAWLPGALPAGMTGSDIK